MMGLVTTITPPTPMCDEDKHVWAVAANFCSGEEYYNKEVCRVCGAVKEQRNKEMEDE